jgi:RNA exonuclease 1
VSLCAFDIDFNSDPPTPPTIAVTGCYKPTRTRPVIVYACVAHVFCLISACSLYIDTSYLFEVENEPGKAPSLRDIAQHVCNVSLAGNRTHDSVQDAKIAVQSVTQLSLQLEKLQQTPAVLAKALECIPIPRMIAGLSQPAVQCLLVHRIPSAYTVDDIKSMFSTCAFVVPLEVQPISYGADEGPAPVGGNIGKTTVAFSSEAHANLAFESLTGPNRPDKNNKAQKRVYLKNGGHICVRKY